MSRFIVVAAALAVALTGVIGATVWPHRQGLPVPADPPHQATLASEWLRLRARAEAGDAAAQLALVRRAAPLVRRGGTLVYSTCSSEPEENQEVVAAFLATHTDFTETRQHQTLPFRDGLEAFYGSVLTRHA